MGKTCFRWDIEGFGTFEDVDTPTGRLMLRNSWADCKKLAFLNEFLYDSYRMRKDEKVGYWFQNALAKCNSRLASNLVELGCMDGSCFLMGGLT